MPMDKLHVDVRASTSPAIYPVDVLTIGLKSKLPWNLMTVQRWKRKRLSPILGSALQGSRKNDAASEFADPAKSPRRLSSAGLPLF